MEECDAILEEVDDMAFECRAEDDSNMLTRSITEYYDEKGVLHEAILKAEVQRFVSRYERGHKKEK